MVFLFSVCLHRPLHGSLHGSLVTREEIAVRSSAAFEGVISMRSLCSVVELNVQDSA